MISTFLKLSAFTLFNILGQFNVKLKNDLAFK